MTTSGVVSGFNALPRRVFLDSSTLQALMRYGNFVWENVRPSPGDRAYSIPGFLGDLEALRLIFQVNERAGFDIVVSPNSVSEVDAKGELCSRLPASAISRCDVRETAASSPTSNQRRSPTCLGSAGPVNARLWS